MSAAGIVNASRRRASERSIGPLCQYATVPERNPKHCVNSAVATAVAGESPSSSMNSGVRKTGPPIPIVVAAVAAAIQIGVRNQWSRMRFTR